MDITDPAKARRLLENALGGQPQLTAEQFDDLISLAEVTRFVDGVPAIFYTDVSLNKAASAGWGWKSALTADKYDLGGGAGRSLSEQQWWDHCQQMATKYGTGILSVTGGGLVATQRPRGIRSIGMVSSAAVESLVPEYIVNAPEVDD